MSAYRESPSPGRRRFVVTSTEVLKCFVIACFATGAWFGTISFYAWYKRQAIPAACVDRLDTGSRVTCDADQILEIVTYDHQGAVLCRCKSELADGGAK